MDLKLRPKEECMFDEISLGEIMLRLDPGEGRIKTARSFRAWEGGGEYNVARGLRRCFGMKTGVVTAFAENEVGYLLEDLILQGGIVERLCRSAFSLPFNGLLVLVLFQFPDKVPHNLYLLSAVSAGLVRRVNNDFLHKLIDDSRR